MRLLNKVALVTGGTRGIGAVMAQRFAEQGARVVLTGRSADAGEQLLRRGTIYPDDCPVR